MRNYVDLEEVKSLIEIKSRIVYNWLHKFGFEYKDVNKDVFVDKYEWPDVFEDHKKFLGMIKELKPYLIQFDKMG